MALYMSDSLARLEGHFIGVRFGNCIKPHPVYSRRMYGVENVCMYIQPSPDMFVARR